MRRFAFSITLALVLGLAAGVAVAEPIGFDDATSWWRMGDTLDDSNAPATDGTAYGSLVYVPAPDTGASSNGRAVSFGGSTRIEYSTAGTELDTDYATGLTCFARVNFDTLSSQIVLNRDGYVYPVDNNDRAFSLCYHSTHGYWLRLWNGTDGVDLRTHPAELTTGEYHDLVGVFQPQTGSTSGYLALYLDGNLVDSKPTTFTALNNPAGVNVVAGRLAGTGTTQFLRGDMESAAIWNQPLTKNEIKRLTIGPLSQTNAAAWLRFDNNADDSNGPPHSNGTANGSLAYIATSSAPPHMSNGSAARFDGSNDWVNLGTGADDELDIDGSNGFTVFARVYPHRTGTGTIVSRDGYAGGGTNPQRSFSLCSFGTRGPLLRVWDGDTEYQALSAGMSFYPGYAKTWHDLVGVFRPNESLEIWIDGQLASTTDMTGVYSINTPAGVPVTLGAAYRTGAGDWFYDGDIESAAFWAYDLSPTEIQRLSVPEPATIGILGIGLLAASRRRRRNRANL